MPGEKFVLPDFSKKNININPDQIKKLLDSICHPYWYKQASGFEEAKLLAAANNRIILLAFTGYSFCGCCQSLEANVFNKCDFGFWAIRNGLILVDIDDNANTNSADSALFNQFGVNYVPTVFGLAPNGQILGEIKNNACGSAGVASWTTEFENVTHMKKSIPKIRIPK